MNIPQDSSLTAQQSERCKRFAELARVDNAGLYQCAKGVANLLADAGLPHQKGDGYTWKDSLPKNGWIKLEGIRPENAPPGAVIAYDRDPPSTRKNNGAGSQFGHVEIASRDAKGNPLYVSDDVRTKPGGTVPHNFAGVFWHPSMGPPPTPGNTQLQIIMAQSDAKEKEKKKPGAYDYLATKPIIPLDAGISQIVIGNNSDVSSNSDIFNTAANKNPLIVLMSLLAVAVAGAAVTNRNTHSADEPVKPFS